MTGRGHAPPERPWLRRVWSLIQNLPEGLCCQSRLAKNPWPRGRFWIQDCERGVGGRQYCSVPGAATRPTCCAKKSRARRPGGANQGGLTSGRREDQRSSNLQASHLKHGPTKKPVLLRPGSTKGVRDPRRITTQSMAEKWRSVCDPSHNDERGPSGLFRPRASRMLRASSGRLGQLCALRQLPAPK